jgi:hypothetical protein
MNRYGQRLGTADQRMAVAGGPWDLQRRALGDVRCAIVGGLRAAMKRPMYGVGAGGVGDVNARVEGHGSTNNDNLMIPLWEKGAPVPNYPYRRPPPVDENDMKEDDEYEASYLAGVCMRPRRTEADGVKGQAHTKQQDMAQQGAGLDWKPRALGNMGGSGGLNGFVPGWNPGV